MSFTWMTLNVMLKLCSAAVGPGKVASRNVEKPSTAGIMEGISSLT